VRQNYGLMCYIDGRPNHAKTLNKIGFVSVLIDNVLDSQANLERTKAIGQQGRIF